MIIKNFFNDVKSVWNKFPVDQKSAVDVCYIVFLGFLVGFCSGLVIALFRLATNSSYHFVLNYVTTHRHSVTVVFLWFSIAIVAALIVSYIIRNKDIRYGGSQWTRGVINGETQLRPWHKILIPKFIGSWLVMACGISVGREGPSIQMGAATALGLKTFDAKMALERKYFLLCGAGSGLASAFSAPFVSLFYVYEIIGEQVPRTLLVFLLGGSFGVYISVVQIFGFDVLLPFTFTPMPDLLHFWFLIPLAIFCACVGIAYNYLLRISVLTYNRQKLLPNALQAFFPFLGAAVMLFVFPIITGEGLRIFPGIEHGYFALDFLFYFVIIKLLFTVFCYGSGVPAGLMVPLLCLGGVAGAFCGGCLINLGLMDPVYFNTCIVLGMGAAFSAGERAPLTAMMLVLEMTGAWETALGMLFVAGIGIICAKLARVRPI